MSGPSSDGAALVGRYCARMVRGCRQDASAGSRGVSRVRGAARCDAEQARRAGAHLVDGDKRVRRAAQARDDGE